MIYNPCIIGNFGYIANRKPNYIILHQQETTYTLAIILISPCNPSIIWSRVYHELIYCFLNDVYAAIENENHAAFWERLIKQNPISFNVYYYNFKSI